MADYGDLSIKVTDLTDNVVKSQDANGNYVVTGSGIFDKIMETVNTHIEAQYDSGRVTGSDYATVYLGSIQAVIAESVRILLNQNVAEQQATTEAAKVALVERQTAGFDDDAKQKALKQLLDSWSVAYSVAQDANSIPDTIKVNVIDSITKDIMDSLSIVKTTDPLGEA